METETMGKILFWNTAGAGVGAKGEELSSTLANYVSTCKPDCVVVCEMKMLGPRMLEAYSFLDFKYVNPTEFPTVPPQRFYKDDDAKRLYVYAKQPGPQAWLIPTEKANRPSVLLLLQTKYIIVVHAPSVSNTSKPQAREFKSAYDQALAQFKTPVAIFGDLNVDQNSNARLFSLKKNLQGHVLAGWNHVSSGENTHKSKSELDWALCDPSFDASVTVVSLHNQNKKSKKKDEDEDWYGETASANKESDHVPILLEW